MPRNEIGQAQNTPARIKPSTGGRNKSAAVALDECLDRLRRVVTDAENWHFKLIHLPNHIDVQALWAEFPGIQTQWLGECCSAIKHYGARLRDHRPDSEWVRNEIGTNWSLLEAQLGRWTGIISEILRFAGTRPRPGLEEAKQARITDEMECSIQATPAWHVREFAAAKQVALGADDLPQKKCDMEHFFDAAKLTDKQREVASLSWEYELKVAQIARRLGKHRKTVDELLAAAQKKVDEAGAHERHGKRRASTSPQNQD
jgi:hypothetical protein